MLKINYNIENKEWLKYLQKNEIVGFVKNIFNKTMEVLDFKISPRKTVEISITFTDDKNIQKLNKEFRNIDKSTNVLSFPLYEKEFFDVVKYEDYVALGDVVLALETIKNESFEQNKSFMDHLIHLVVHSLLHLLGYDHVEEKDAEEMEGIEIVVLSKFGVENPY